MMIYYDMKSLNSVSMRSKRSNDDPDKAQKDAVDNKKKLKVVKEAHKNLKAR